MCPAARGDVSFLASFGGFFRRLKWVFDGFFGGFWCFAWWFFRRVSLVVAMSLWCLAKRVEKTGDC